MRCLLPEHQVTQGRIKYLIKVFNLYFLSKRTVNNLLELVSIPSTALDLVFIVGHYNDIYQYLQSNVEQIPESLIVVISCYPKDFSSIPLNGKKLLVAKADTRVGGINIYKGEDYGFDFDITEAELNLYNSKQEDVLSKIVDTFIDIKDI